MANFVEDTFTEASDTYLENHTGEVGATWTPYTAAGGAAERGYVHSSVDQCRHVTSECSYYASGSPATAEYDVTANFIGAASGDTSLLGRCDTGAATHYLAQWTAGAFNLYKRVAGTYTLLGSYSQSLVDSQLYSVKLEIRDAAKKVYVDGVERISSADNAITGAGKAGLRIFNAGSFGTLYLDNFVATDASSPPPPPSGDGGFVIIAQQQMMMAG